MNCTPEIPMGLVVAMHNASEKFLQQRPDLREHPYAAENVYWSPSIGCGSYTLHTHLVKDRGGEKPSEADKRSTKNLEKDNLCIINTDGRWIRCWNKKDNFKTVIYNKKY